MFLDLPGACETHPLHSNKAFRIQKKEHLLEQWLWFGGVGEGPVLGFPLVFYTDQ